MPRYDVTLDTDTAMKGVVFNVPPVGGIANGDTVEGVFLDEETANFLETNPAIKVKKRPDLKVGDVVKAAEKATTYEELDELAAGEDRDSAVAAITAARVALADKDALETEETVEVEVEAASTGVPLADSPQVTDSTTEGGEG